MQTKTKQIVHEISAKKRKTRKYEKQSTASKTAESPLLFPSRNLAFELFINNRLWMKKWTLHC